VLLKNTDHCLPLDPQRLKSLAIIGPQANDSLVLLGNYHGLPAHGVVTPLQAIQERLNTSTTVVRYSHGAWVTGEGSWQFSDAVAAAAAADVAVIFVGGSAKGSFEGVCHSLLIASRTRISNKCRVPCFTPRCLFAQPDPFKSTRLRPPDARQRRPASISRLLAAACESGLNRW